MVVVFPENPPYSRRLRTLLEPLLPAGCLWRTLEEREDFAALAGERAGAGDVLLFEDGLSPDGLRRLCDAVLHACGGRCACFSGTDGWGYKYAVGQLGGDLRSFVKELNNTLSGRGGGKPDFVQGGVQAKRGEIERFFQ